MKTKDFLQADRLSQVGDVARAVAAGAYTDAAIEAYLGLDSKGRQGRYYRHAAQVLDLIDNEHNHAVLTPVGIEFSTLDTDEARLEFLARLLTEAPVFKEALQYIVSVHPNDQQLKLWHRKIFPGSPNTADRRLSTLLSYFRDTHLIDTKGGRNYVTKHIGTVSKIEVPAKDPLSGKNPPMSAPVFADAGATLKVDMNFQKHERASTVHWQLIDGKSSSLLRLGQTPKSNPHIDLFSTANGRLFIYEMKSINTGSGNLLSQIRKAVSQLYEYRFIYDQTNAVLSIVTNAELSKSQQWLATYLARDRKIAYEWTKDFQNFNSDADSIALLNPAA